MANRLNYNDLLKYMEIVLDMEKNVYVELKSWQDLQGQMNRLGMPRKYNKPVRYSTTNLFLRFLASFFGGAIVGFIAVFVLIVGACTVGHIAQTDLPTPKTAITVGVITWIIVIIIAMRSAIMEKNYEKNRYSTELNDYNTNLSNDNARVQRELAQKQYLQTQADTLAAMWRTSKEKLDKMYSYDILEEKYRNIVAVASIYEYLKHERTRSLQRVGSDEGAYNIFESEVRLNKIITNTDIIIQKLDVVIENQRELANTMRNAQNSINNLVTSTNNMSARLQSGMKQLNASVELSNYQQQQTNNELRYMNFMNTLHFYS